jgi:hypothetical protein
MELFFFINLRTHAYFFINSLSLSIYLYYIKLLVLNVLLQLCFFLSSQKRTKKLYILKITDATNEFFFLLRCINLYIFI